MEKEEKKLFEEYKLELIRLDADIICTSPGTQGTGGEVIDPFDDPNMPEGPEIFD